MAFLTRLGLKRELAVLEATCIRGLNGLPNPIGIETKAVGTQINPSTDTFTLFTWEDV
jgi:hypothetical protein